MGISLREVSFTYFPQKKKSKNEYIINNINLDINKEKEFIVIVGHTGSGKSTIVSLMNALLIPTLGSVSVYDHVITYKKQDKLKSVRKKVGLVFQFPEYQLFEETVLKDVMFGPKNFKLDNPETKAKEALAMFNIGEEMYHKNPYRLSGGEMRKVAISGILASEPEILILDEPTVGLDPLTKNDLIQKLKAINENKNIIMITHDMNILWEVATRVIVVHDKTICYDGNKYDLFKDQNLLNKYSLDYPEIIKIGQRLNEKLNLGLNVFQDSLEDLLIEIKKQVKYEW